MQGEEQDAKRIPDPAVEEFAGLQDEISQYARSSKIEREERRKLVEALKTLLISMEHPLSLQAPLLRQRAGETISLDSRCVLTTVDSDGKSTSRPLLDLERGLFLSVVEEAARELIRFASKGKSEELEWDQPKLLASINLNRSRGVSSQRKSGRLVLSNSGGDSRKLRVVITFRKKTKTYAFTDHKHGQKAFVDLRYFGALNPSDSIKVLITCVGIGGVGYKWVGFLSWSNEEPQEVRLQPSRAA